MAAELLLAFGAGEPAYLAWATEQAEPTLRTHLLRLRVAISGGRRSAFARLPSPSACRARLGHSDPVVRLMAAQVLSFHGPDERSAAVLADGERLYWRDRPSVAVDLPAD